MIPQKGDYVKVYFNNGFAKEGYVLSWSDNKSVLALPNSEELIVINKTLEDIFLYTIKKSKDKPVYREEEDKTITDNLPRDNRKRIQAIVERRGQTGNKELQRVREHMNDPNPQVRETEYGAPLGYRPTKR